jgi:hypothetical protein
LRSCLPSVMKILLIYLMPSMKIPLVSSSLELDSSIGRFSISNSTFSSAEKRLLPFFFLLMYKGVFFCPKY